ncbi:MAG: hypothetical protein FI707_00865 [SAR202 cluster bacterium]|nr:hypothetical protein [SAR202 cluster bacterium]
MNRSQGIIRIVRAIAFEQIGEIIEEVAKVPQYYSFTLRFCFCLIIPTPGSDDLPVVAVPKAVFFELSPNLGGSKFPLRKITYRSTLARLLYSLVELLD